MLTETERERRKKKGHIFYMSICTDILKTNKISLNEDATGIPCSESINLKKSHVTDYLTL